MSWLVELDDVSRVYDSFHSARGCFRSRPKADVGPHQVAVGRFAQPPALKLFAQPQP
jgi:hypothetical protein